MKPLPTKADLRKELEQQIEQYLSTGGKVQEVPRGQSGRVDNDNPFTSYNSDKPSETRTPLNDVIKAMEERKNPKQLRPPLKKRPRKRLITDDFGEPLRWVWDEE